MPVGIPKRSPQNLSPYALSKYATEKLAIDFFRALGILVVTLRYYNVYGLLQGLSNTYTGVIATFPSRMKSHNRPQIFENSMQMRDYVHLEDVALVKLSSFEVETICQPDVTFKHRDNMFNQMIALADVAVVVSDAKASAKWWKRNLGFATFTIGGSGHAVMVAPPGDRFVLHLCQGFATLEPGDTGIAFVTDEIDRLSSRMKRGNVLFTEPVSEEEWGKMAKFADPDGNIFWLLEAPSKMVRDTLKSCAPELAKRKAKRSSRSKKH